MILTEKSHLVLGWRTTSMLEPAYWVDGTPQAGLQTDSDLVRVPADSIGRHTAIIAQSGSGKSFLLGRLVEEIIIRTKSRCIILDPNADFRRVHDVEDLSLWTAAHYDRQKRRGKLPNEKTRSDFADLWPRSNIRIRTRAGGGAVLRVPYESLQLSWPSLSMDVLAEDIDPMLRTDLYHCHSFVRELEELHGIKETTPVKTRALIDEAEQLLRQARTMPEAVRSTLDVRYNADEMVRDPPKGRVPAYVARVFPFFTGVTSLPTDLLRRIKSNVRSKVTSLTESLVRAPQYISPVVEHFYFSRARSYEISGVVTAEVEKARRPLHASSWRLEVVDLPSLKDQPTRLLAVNAIMSDEWDSARQQWNLALERDPARDNRVPTFIVIDEAHNLIPANPRSKAESAVREIFRTIVAEGRKYGLFVVLVSQRPDKVDPVVLSECENKAVMKLSSGAVLTMTRSLLGLDDIHPKMLERCLDFDLGRALLVGPWATTGPQFMYCAARRTIEGGRNLRDEYWSTPADRRTALRGPTSARRQAAKKRAAGGKTSR